MASLRSLVSEYKDELRNGMHWVAFWKEGRSWKAESFFPEDDDSDFDPEDQVRLREIYEADKNAALINGYWNCPFSPDEPCSIDFMVEHIRRRYEEQLALVSENDLVNLELSTEKAVEPEAVEEVKAIEIQTQDPEVIEEVKALPAIRPETDLQIQKSETKKPAPKVPTHDPENLWKLRLGWLKLGVMSVTLILMGTVLGMIRWAADAEREVRKGIRWTSGKVKIYWPVIKAELEKLWKFRAELIAEWR